MSTKHRSSQSGSAYMVTLFGLIVLTILGLSLANITTTEMEVGLNERVATRAFYSTEAGLNVAFARMLTAGGTLFGQRLTITQNRVVDGDPESINRAYDISVSGFFPVLAQTCGWCGQNEGDNSSKYKRVNLAVSATANERLWKTSETTPPDSASIESQKSLAVMYDVSPFELRTENMPQTTADLEQLKF
ncbi:MAG: pilus assembly PilX N-terminal domain-containing protein [Thermoanaerobaculia bacterium]